MRRLQGALLGALVACGPAPFAHVRPGEGDAFRVRNETSDSICYLEVQPARGGRPNADPPYTFDRLGASDVIAPGEERTFAVAAGEHAVRLLNCNRTTLFEDAFAPRGTVLVLRVR